MRARARALLVLVPAALLLLYVCTSCGGSGQLWGSTGSERELIARDLTAVLLLTNTTNTTATATTAAAAADTSPPPPPPPPPLSALPPFRSVRPGSDFAAWNERRLLRQRAALAACEHLKRLQQESTEVKALPTGGWCLEESFGGDRLTPLQPMAREHVPADPGISAVLAELFAHSSVLDLGAGIGQYSVWFRNHSVPFEFYESFDGSPDVERFTNGSVHFIDLTSPDALDALAADWILCLEVGEHLPSRYEDVLLQNLHRANRRGIVLSWGVPGQGGFSHVNERNNSYVVAKLAALGYDYDTQLSTKLRFRTTYYWFQDSIMVFRRR
jgi:hypothetical protein